MAEPTLNALFWWNVERVTVTMLPAPWFSGCVEGVWVGEEGVCVCEEGCGEKECVSNEGRSIETVWLLNKGGGGRGGRGKRGKSGREEEKGGGGNIVTHLAIGL